jgi:leukotriene-A4 hydrolase
VLGLKDLRRDLARLKPADQILAIDLRDRDPGDGFSYVPYEKGRLFLNYLDAKFGRERFDAFLRGYFDHFAFKSVNSGQFMAYLQENLLDKFPGVVTRADVNTWILSPGLPADALLPVTNLFQAVDAARNAWLAGKLAAKKIGAEWVAQQWLYFLDGMPPALTAAQLADLDKSFGLSKSPNAEIGHSWFKLVIANDYQPGFPHLEEYLRTIGRRKLIEPLYEALMKTPAGSAVAKRVFAKAKPGYHPETVKAIQAIVTPKEESSE